MKSIKIINRLRNNSPKIKAWKILFRTVYQILFLGKTERDTSLGQLKMIEGLQKQFKTKYENILHEAQ